MSDEQKNQLNPTEALCVSAQMGLEKEIDTAINALFDTLEAQGVPAVRITGVVLGALADALFTGISAAVDGQMGRKEDDMMTPDILHRINMGCMQAIITVGRHRHPDAANAIRAAVEAHKEQTDGTVESFKARLKQ